MAVPGTIRVVGLTLAGLLTVGVGARAQQVATRDGLVLLRTGAEYRVANREVKESGTCDLPTGPVNGNRFSNTVEGQGRVTAVRYARQQGQSVGDVYRELSEQLRAAGLRPLFTCRDGDCGHGRGPANFCAPAWNGRNGQRHLTGVVSGPGGATALVSLHVQAPDNRERATAYLTVVEMDSDRGLGAGFRNGGNVIAGRTVELREPLFRGNSAELTSNGSDEIADVAAQVRRIPGLRVTIINRTHTEAGFMTDLELSTDRVRAIRSVLEANGVTRDRIRIQALGRAIPKDESFGRGEGTETHLVLEAAESD